MSTLDQESENLSQNLDSMSAEDISLWLKNEGFPPEVCDAFQDQDMDGEAVTAALAITPGPDCLKDVLPKLGQRLKVYKAFQEHITAQFGDEDSVIESLAKKRRTSQSDTSSVDSHRSPSTSGSTSCTGIPRKPTKSPGPPVKRPKLNPTAHRYPTIENGEDEASYNRNLDLMNKELAEQQPSMAKLKEYMSRTFSERRHWIVSSAISAEEIWSKFSLLKKARYVSDEFERIMKKPLANDFASGLSRWIKATVEYALSTSVRSTGLRHALRDIPVVPAPSGERSLMDVHELEQLTGLRCLGQYLILKKRAGKQESNPICDIPFILNICRSGTPPSDCIDKSNNLPHIVKLCNVDNELPPQYFIALEQELIIECRPSLFDAVYMLLAVHYVFNVVYQCRAVHFFKFLEEKVLQVQSSTKFNANCASAVTGIGLFLDGEN